MMRLLSWLVLMLAFPVGFAHGFKGFEHRDVSADAFRLAYSHFLALGHPPDPAVEELIASLERGGSYLEYGDLVVLVDHMVDPLKTLERQGSLDSFPCSIEDLDRDMITNFLPKDLAEYRALTVNETHFGAELLLNLRFWHQAATEMAASGTMPFRKRCGLSMRSGNLLTALMLNSIADHFLEDFFAPGHIYTPRFGLHDAVAGAMHDQYNILGTEFYVDFEAWDELRGIVDSMPSEMLKGMGLSEEELQEIRRHGIHRLELWGDGDLAKSPRQRLFMTLVVARSVLDVLESYSWRCRVDSFAEGTTWSSLHGQGGNPLSGITHAEGEIHFGRHSARAYQGSLRTPVILWASPGGEMLVKGEDASSRWIIETDILAYWFFRFYSGGKSAGRPTLWQAGVSAGYSYAWNEYEQADGPRMSLILAYPMIHSQFLIEVLNLDYKSGKVHRTKWGYGVGFQTGFSLMTLDLRLGRGYRFDGAREFRETWTVRSGITVAVPLLRIPLLGRIERVALERFRRGAMR